jgi:hypothetical protein
MHRVATAKPRRRPGPHDERGLPLMRFDLDISERGGRMLKVVHRAEGTTEVLVTAHFDRGAMP